MLVNIISSMFLDQKICLQASWRCLPKDVQGATNCEKATDQRPLEEKWGTMTRKTINAILGLASVDQVFCQQLLDNPLQAVQAKNFELSEDEQEIFRRISARDLYEFSQILLTFLDPQDRR